MEESPKNPVPDASERSDEESLPTEAGRSGGDHEPEEPPFRYVHSTNFPALLEGLRASLVVTTYQAGKLVVFRSRGGKLSMLLRTFDKAMGLAADARRMSIATTYQIWTLRNSPQVAARLEPKGTHDACFLPRTSHVTGNIDCHEIAWAGEELWAVNTLFSCLCTLDPEYSFVPRWRPPFITGLARHDRCHLNGLALADGRPRYVTVFGETNEPEGWRPGKLTGGCVIDVETGETIVRGLSMPHSPRIHDDQLWVLNSGHGQLALVDRGRGRLVPVADLPGYTRGLAFAGRFAFVGLSKIRETAVFGGVPIAERMQERKCGVSVVDTQTGQIAAFLEFDQTVEEIFDVQLLPGVRFPAVVGFGKDTIHRACVIAPERRIGLRAA